MSSDNGEDEKSIDESEASEPVTDELIKAENGVPREGVNKATEERVEEDEDEDEDEDGDEDDEDDDEDNDLSSNSDSDTDPSDISDAESSTTDQQTLRKMMGESQKSVLASISQATKADAAKGRAVKQQRQTFDALLNTRIRLQKALVAANSLSVATPSAKPSSPSPSLVSEPDDAPSFQAAEEAAFNLWQSLHNLRTSLISSSSPSTLKRKRSFTSTTPLSNLWTETQALTTASFLTHRAILDKWARKTRTTTTLPSTSRRLNHTSTDQPLTSIIDSHLSTATLPRLLLKTTVPRSCAPIQAASPHPSTTSTTTTNTTDPTTVPLLNPSQVYDDSDLYQSLLTTLVAQRTANLSLANSTATTLLPSTALGLPKLPKQHRLTRTADKKASKGRKVRYDVRDKLQNFMAAEVTGPGWWEESRVGEFFTGLVGGVKRGLREEEEGGEKRDNDDGEESDGDGDGDGDGEDSESRRGMSGLRLFG